MSRREKCGRDCATAISLVPIVRDLLTLLMEDEKVSEKTRGIAQSLRHDLNINEIYSGRGSCENKSSE